MTQAERLAELDKLGEALKATGEREISLFLFASDDRPFCVGIVAGVGAITNCYGHGRTPSEALSQARAKRAAKGQEIALRARIAAEVEERVRAELAAHQPQDIAA